MLCIVCRITFCSIVFLTLVLILKGLHNTPLLWHLKKSHEEICVNFQERMP